MPLPRIGITLDRGQPGRYALHEAYVLAVQAAGALPILIPFGLTKQLVDQYLDMVQGIVFIGGDDLDPAHFNQPLHPSAIPVDPARQASEYALLAQAEQRRMPLLGICMGCQLMNVHRGGDLIQFLPDHQRDNPLEHRRLDLPMRRHPVRLSGDSILGRALGKDQLDANTSHKQAIDRPGKNLRVIARAPDGVIEAIEDPSLPFFLGVQWHPERLIDEPDHLTLFRLLVDAGRVRMNDEG